MGDSVSVAIIKGLDEKTLTNPQSIRDYLTIIRDGFAAVDLIERRVDRNPDMTRLLFKYLKTVISDAGTLQKIDDTWTSIAM